LQDKGLAGESRNSKTGTSLHANPLAQNPGTGKTGFGQVKIMKEFVLTDRHFF